MPHNDRFHTYLIKEAVIDLKELAKTDKHRAERLEDALAKIHMLRGDVCGIKEEQPITDKVFHFDAPGGSATIGPFECGHSYHASPAVPLRPMCKICLARMEASVKANPSYWTMEEPKGFLQKAAEKISGKDVTVPKDAPSTPPTKTVKDKKK